MTRKNLGVLGYIAGGLTVAVFLASGAWAGEFNYTYGSSAAGGDTDGPIVDADPFLGDWDGGWDPASPLAKQNPHLVAQVIPRGHDKYQINLLMDFDHRAMPLAVVDGHAEGGKLVFDEAGFTGTFSGETCEGTGATKTKPAKFTLKKVTRLSPTLGAKAPAGAVVLFDGSNYDAWKASGKEQPINWTIKDNAMIVSTSDPKNRMGIESKEGFGDCKLHIEFRLPLEPENTGQGRGNSGVFLGDYEVQVLDSYGLAGFYNECGALYKLAAPKVNMCAPPLQWQTYDIVYRAPRFKDGKLAENPRMTVDHNGVRIHDDQEIHHHTSNTQSGRNNPVSQAPAQVKLQNHGHNVAFRNIWVEKL